MSAFYRVPALGDPWPGGHTTGSWRCWCVMCRGFHYRIPAQRDEHMLKNGLCTQQGEVTSLVYLRHIPHGHPDDEKPLYEGATISRGKFCELMERIKVYHNVPISAMEDLYKLIKEILPQPNLVPGSTRH